MKVKSKFGPQHQTFEVGDIVFLAKDKPLKLSNGREIKNFPLAYQTYGSLNQDKSNAILICHALTGDQYAASKHPITKKDGWWDFMIGPGKPIDTDKFFVISSNIIGSCLGSFGPKEIDPETNQPYGLKFPVITIDDMVRAQNLLIENFGIEKLHAVIGGSTGGMQALSWAVLFPTKVNLIIPVSTSYRHAPQNIAFHEVGRQAIMADNNWNEGHYYNSDQYPSNGLAVARMTAHITYLSETSLQKKFGRNLQDKEALSFSLEGDFAVESYLHHQGQNFVNRFDPNSYIYITKAVDYFDIERDFDGNLANAFIDFAKNKNGKFCLISFSDDWLFPPTEAKKLTRSLISCGVNVSSITVNSSSGHDSFLIENDTLKNTVRGFLNQ